MESVGSRASTRVQKKARRGSSAEDLIVARGGSFSATDNCEALSQTRREGKREERFHKRKQEAQVVKEGKKISPNTFVSLLGTEPSGSSAKAFVSTVDAADAAWSCQELPSDRVWPRVTAMAGSQSAPVGPRTTASRTRGRRATTSTIIEQLEAHCQRLQPRSSGLIYCSMAPLP